MPNRSVGRTNEQLVAEDADLRARLEAAAATLCALCSTAGGAHTVGAPDASGLVAADQTSHRRVERILATRLRLLEFATAHALGDLPQATLDEHEILTGSQIAFYRGVLGPDVHFLQKPFSLQGLAVKVREALAT